MSGQEGLQLILAHPFAAWRTFLHPSQHEIARRPSYSGPAQVTGGPGTGKTVTVLHRAAFLAARAAAPPSADSLPVADHMSAPGTSAEQVLVTTFNGNLADALAAQLDLLICDAGERRRIEVLNVDRLAYRIVKQARGTPVIADERVLRTWWAQAAATAGLAFTPAFLKNEWEQVILAQDLHTEHAYLTCPRIGRRRPLTKAQRSQVWQAAQHVTTQLAASGQSSHLQLADEATHLLRQAGAPRYRHILVDEAQDLHPSQWRLLRAAVAPGPDDLFLAADPHQRIYNNRVSLASLGISVRGRSRRLSLNYRTTQGILAWAVPLLGTDPVTGLDGEVDSLLGYRSPMHGQRPQLRVAATRDEEFALLGERIRSWLEIGIEPQAIGVTARSDSLVREAREALKADGIMTVSLSGRGRTGAVRADTMHAMKGLEFQAVAVIGVEQGLVPDPAAVTPEGEDAVAHAQDLQRERCVLFVACTRARDHLYVSRTGEPSMFLPPHEPDPPPSYRSSVAPVGAEESTGNGAVSPCKVSMREPLLAGAHTIARRAVPALPSVPFEFPAGLARLRLLARALTSATTPASLRVIVTCPTTRFAAVAATLGALESNPDCGGCLHGKLTDRVRASAYLGGRFADTMILHAGPAELDFGGERLTRNRDSVHRLPAAFPERRDHRLDPRLREQLVSYYNCLPAAVGFRHSARCAHPVLVVGEPTAVRDDMAVLATLDPGAYLAARLDHGNLSDGWYRHPVLVAGRLPRPEADSWLNEVRPRLVVFAGSAGWAASWRGRWPSVPQLLLLSRRSPSAVETATSIAAASWPAPTSWAQDLADLVLEPGGGLEIGVRCEPYQVPGEEDEEEW